MNHGPLLFLGVLVAVALSWAGAVMVPQFQIGAQSMVRIEETGQDYPLARSGLARQGAAVYRAQGCQYCHTQQVREPGEGRDMARGWGSRRTVARDYLRDEPALPGSVRFGPDLANLGLRFGVREEEQEEVRNTLLLKLYEPRSVVPGSSMPRYPYLFDERERPAGRPASAGALRFPEGLEPAGNREVLPRPEAEALVAYLLSLRAEPLFFEVFPPVQPTPATNGVPVEVVEPNSEPVP